MVQDTLFLNFCKNLHIYFLTMVQLQPQAGQLHILLYLGNCFLITKRIKEPQQTFKRKVAPCKWRVDKGIFQ